MIEPYGPFLQNFPSVRNSTIYKCADELSYQELGAISILIGISNNRAIAILINNDVNQYSVVNQYSDVNQ